MNNCYECGTPLVLKECGEEGMVQYCEHCKEFRFPIFNTAMSTVVFNQKKDKILLIQQYQRNRNVLVAGYVTKGESVEDTVVREVMEEIGLNVIHREFVKSEFFPPSNTLMLNFQSIVDSEDLSHLNTKEVDRAAWFSIEEAKEAIVKPSVAERFLYANLERLGLM